MEARSIVVSRGSSSPGSLYEPPSVEGTGTEPVLMAAEDSGGGGGGGEGVFFARQRCFRALTGIVRYAVGSIAGRTLVKPDGPGQRLASC